MLERNAYAGITRQRLRELLHPSHLDDGAITGLIQQMGLDLGKDVLLAQFITTIDRPDLMARLPELACPVLIVGAENDKLVHPDDLRAMAARLPQATLHMIGDDCGHMVPLEAPAVLAEAMLAFLAPGRTIERQRNFNDNDAHRAQPAHCNLIIFLFGNFFAHPHDPTDHHRRHRPARRHRHRQHPAMEAAGRPGPLQAPDDGPPHPHGPQDLRFHRPPLPNRRNIVITRNPDWRHDGVEAVSSLEEAVALLAGAKAT
jgi:hypothetical protein